MLGKDSSTTPISEVMSVPLWTVLPSTNVSDAISLMRKKGFRRLVVKDPKRIFGVVTLMQLIGNSREAAILLPFLEGEEDACPVCGKLFKSREDVREHMQAEIHS
jgi:signal-transduction protein with cAMP-binding, CBS, and nucleotidyltransferase domain